MDICQIDGAFEKYQNLLLEISAFLRTYSFPSTRAELVVFLDKGDQLHDRILALKSEVGFLRSELFREYSTKYRELYASSSHFSELQKWEVDIVVGRAPELNDIQMTLDKLQTMQGTLESYMWLLKERRSSAVSAITFLSGFD